MTIYEKTAGALIPQQRRTVATFPSGLVRVDHTYIGKTSLTATHRAFLAVGNDPPDGNTDPAIDGLKIFPDTQEIQRGDGFTEYKVSLYGRTTESLRVTGTIPFNRQATNGLRYNTWQVFGALAAPKDSILTYDSLGLDPALLDPFNFATNDPEEYMLTLNSGVQIVEYDSYVTPLGNFALLPSTRTRTYYTVDMTTDGTTVSSTYGFWLDDPEIVITSRRNFGEFFELELYTQRRGDFETLSAPP